MIPECHLSTFSFKQKISLLPTTSGGWEVLGVETPQYRESDKIGGGEEEESDQSAKYQ